MTARILVVDDEPDLETLILQKFRHQIRDGAVSFLFAHDGVEALAAAGGEPRHRPGSHRHQHAEDGRTVAAAEAAGERREALDHHRLGVWRHGQHSHRDEPRRIRFSDQADRFSSISRRRLPRPFGMSRSCATHGDGRRRPNGRMRRSRVTSRPIWRTACQRRRRD